MPLLRSSKYTCFYCNRRSNQAKVQGLRQWHCDNCGSDNFLDENGEITDPPAATTASAQNTRYVQPKPAPLYPIVDAVTSDTSGPIFCATCLKNQQLYNAALANFYPSPTRSDFQDCKAYEQAENDYREGLEERYPLICEKCEAGVLAKLKEANYFAKTQNFGSIHQRLGGRSAPKIGMKGHILWLGGLTWAMSWLLQLVWHGLGILPRAAKFPGLAYPASYCFKSLVVHREILPSCFTTAGDGLAFYALIMAYASVWWHPKLRDKLERPKSKLIGVGDYYKIQALSLLVRQVAWYIDIDNSRPEDQSRRAIHLFMAVVSLVMITSSRRAIRLDFTPFTYKSSPERLVKRRNPVPEPNLNNISPSYNPLLRGSQPRPFSILDYDVRDTEFQYPGRAPPTPPPEDDYYNANPSAMDWQPTSLPLPHPSRPHNLPSPLKPRPEPPAPVRPASQTRRGPTHGHLAQPVHGPSAARLLPKQKKTKPIYPSARRATGHPLDLDSMSSALLDDEFSPSTIPNDVDSPKSIETLSPERRDGAYLFARPKFFAAGEKEEAETGLEGLFERAFRVGDEPVEVRERRVSEERVREGVRRAESVRGAVMLRSFVGLAVVVALAAVFVGVTKWFAEGDGAFEGVLGIWIKRFFAVE